MISFLYGINRIFVSRTVEKVTQVSQRMRELDDCKDFLRENAFKRVPYINPLYIKIILSLKCNVNVSISRILYTKLICLL